MINIKNVTFRLGERILLDQATVQISDGWKVGIVGPNGCGKSTLFKIFKQEVETQDGSIDFSTEQKLVFVEQEFHEEDLSKNILDYVLSQDKERSSLLTQLETAPNEELDFIHERLRLIGADTAPYRAAEILSGLGFSQDDLPRTVKEFSGGWQMRLALAAALFRPSDVMLLDEPTNHLDLEASLWLEQHLQRYKGTLLIISHDKNLLNNLCNHIVHFDHGKLVLYSGNYDAFRRTRSLQQEVLAKQAAKIAEKRRHLQSYVDRFRYKASKAKQAQSRMKMIEKLEDIALLEDDAQSVFKFPQPQALASPFLSIEDGVAGYGDKVVLKRLNLQISQDDKIALLGANGNGKSTLAKVISGRLELLNGQRKASQKLKIGYFAQHQTEELPMDLTAYEYMSSFMPSKTETEIRSHLAGFGLDKEKALTQISLLSGGEKARLLFAAMTYDAPQLLILDEPTNHLDIQGREALVKALNEYDGAVILITHDLYFLELTADNLWLVEKQTCKPYSGDLEDYRQYLLSIKDKEKSVASSKAIKETEKSKANNWQEKKNLQSQIRRLEKELAQLSEQKKQVEARFLQELSVDELINNQKELSEIEKKQQDIENQWIFVSEQLETLKD